MTVNPDNGWPPEKFDGSGTLGTPEDRGETSQHDPADNPMPTEERQTSGKAKKSD